MFGRILDYSQNSGIQTPKISTQTLEILINRRFLLIFFKLGLHGLSHGLQCLGASAPVQGAVQVAQPALQGLLQRRFLCGVAVGILIEAWWFRRTNR